MHGLTQEIIAEVGANARPRWETDDDGKRTRVGRSLRRGSFERRLIACRIIDGVEYGYHATKGWRRRRVEASAKGGN